MSGDDKHIKSLKIRKCDGCGRTLPSGSRTLRWSTFNQGMTRWMYFCSDCERVIYGCEGHPKMDIDAWWCVRDVCERCGKLESCDKVGYQRSSEPGDLFFGDLEKG